MSRRCFLQVAAAGVASSAPFAMAAQRIWADTATRDLIPKSKIRIGKIYVGHRQPGWPMTAVNLEAEVKRHEAELARLKPLLADVDFIDGGLVENEQQLAQAKLKLEGVTGILVHHLTLGTGPLIQSLLELNKPAVMFTTPYSGHEWHIVSGWQRQGKPIEVLPSSRFEDIPAALRPFRAIQRLAESTILHVNHGEADPVYCKVIGEKFGTRIVSIQLPELQKTYQSADESAAQADARRWIREARKTVEPGKEEILKSSRMYIAMKDLLARHNAQTITMNCLGMGLIDRGMGYPCLGFVRLNNMGLGGVCEADLKSSMTHLLFVYLVGKPGFVTDPVFDVSNSTIIHAHCVAATQMQGPDRAASPYVIRSHLEDGKGASLQVKLPVGQKVSMARLIGTDLLLFSTGDAVESPFDERGCRTKLTMRVANIQKFLENWSCGLHRVVFYGDHSQDVRRFCRFKNIRVLVEGVDDLQNVPGLEWEPVVHA